MFFYLWHIHQAGLKHYFKKKIDLMVYSHIFVEMGDVMYLRKVGIHPTQIEVERKALNKFCQPHTKYPSSKPFFYYIDAYWAPKVGMWCTNAWNIRYANQDINVAIEAYNGNLKEKFKSMKCRLEGWRLD